MLIARQEDVTSAALEVMARTREPRMREIMISLVAPSLDSMFTLPGGAPRQIGNPVRSAAESAGRLDWHNELSSLILDIDEQMSLAADERARKQIVRRLRRALSPE